MPKSKQNSSRFKRPSIKDVAKQAGVSIATVSHVFSGKKRVNDELAQHVRKTAKDLSYSIDRVASQLRSGRARVVAVLVPDLEDLFLNQLVSKLENCAQEAGYELIVSTSRDTPEIEAKRLHALLAWRPAGIIIAPCKDTISDELLPELEATPLVGVDRVHPSNANFDTITVDNFGSGLMAAKYLKGQGTKSSLLVAGDLSLHNIKERIRGYRELSSKIGDAKIDVLETGAEPVHGSTLIQEWLKTNPRPDTIVGLTNVTTLASLAALAKLDIEVSRDIKVLGFHDSLWMTARKMPITTLAQPVGDVARCAWERLALRMSGDIGPQQNIVLSSTLIERASTISQN